MNILGEKRLGQVDINWKYKFNSKCNVIYEHPSRDLSQVFTYSSFGIPFTFHWITYDENIFKLINIFGNP